MASGTFTFQTVVVPGAAGGTWLGGINNAGQVAGYSEDSRAIPQSFVYAGGSFSPVIAGIADMAHGINNAGQVVGSDGNNKIGENAFLWSGRSSQEVVMHSNGGSGPIIRAYGINDAGSVVGGFSPAQGAPSSGFIFQNGVSSFFHAPGATTTEAHGINNAGTVVGSADNHGFVDVNGQFSAVDVPGAVATDPAAVNLAGIIAGSYFDGAHWHGFIDNAGQLTFINAPGAADTWVTGENDVGQLVGYSDTVPNGPTSGFIATDPPAAAVAASFGHSAAGHPLFGVPHHMMHGHT